MATFILTVIGDDRPGLVSALSVPIKAHGASWERSQMSRLAGKFAGIVLVAVADERLDALAADLTALAAQGLQVDPRANRRARRREAQRLQLELLGADHPGIVAEVSASLAARGVSIEELTTDVREAPMAGGTLFEARAVLTAPPTTSIEALAVDARGARRRADGRDQPLGGRRSRVGPRLGRFQSVSSAGRRARVEDVHELALGLPHVTVVHGSGGNPVYQVGGKSFVFFRTPRPDAVDPVSGERLPDVIVFWVASEGDKQALVQDESTPFFTTAHFDGHPSVLLRASRVGELTRQELAEVVEEAWLSRASKRRADAWLGRTAHEHDGPAPDDEGSALPVRSGPRGRDPQDHPSLALHAGPVGVPVVGLARDAAVVLHERLHRVGQRDHLGLTLDVDPVPEEPVVQHAQLGPGVGAEVLGLVRRLPAADREPSLVVHADEDRALLDAGRGARREHRPVVRADELACVVKVHAVILARPRARCQTGSRRLALPRTVGGCTVEARE